DDALDGPRGRGRAAGRRSAVDENVHAAELSGGLLHHRLHLLTARDVSRDGNDSAPCLGGQLRRRGLEKRFRARSRDDVGTLPAQLTRDGFADAAAAAGDDRVPSREPKIHRAPPPPPTRRRVFYRRAGSKGRRSTTVGLPSVIISATASPVAGAFSIPHGPWPVATYAPVTPGTRPMSGRPSSVTGRE